MIVACLTKIQQVIQKKKYLEIQKIPSCLVNSKNIGVSRTVYFHLIMIDNSSGLF